MSQFAPKQIAKWQQAFVGFSGFSTAGGTSDTVTTAITTALSSAGDGGVSVPVQVGNRTQEGVNTASGLNLCQIYAGTTGLRLTDGSGNDVYGKITLSGSTWTLAYFSAPNGTETPFTMAASTNISVEFPYVFSFEHFPYTAGTATTDRHIAPDLSTVSGRFQTDVLTVTGANTLSALSQTYAGPNAFLYIRGKLERMNGSSPAFSVANKAVTWNASNAGYALSTDDDAMIVYNY